ncbi:MAG: hypothetical protein LBO08_00690 [Rickettsiales bacterium]|jgi:hypothetical protein|nr:hypothetical protein [Rickettsiales bacterium]
MIVVGSWQLVRTLRVLLVVSKLHGQFPSHGGVPHQRRGGLQKLSEKTKKVKEVNVSRKARRQNLTFFTTFTIHFFTAL